MTVLNFTGIKQEDGGKKMFRQFGTFVNYRPSLLVLPSRSLFKLSKAPFRGRFIFLPPFSCHSRQERTEGYAPFMARANSTADKDGTVPFGIFQRSALLAGES